MLRNLQTIKVPRVRKAIGLFSAARRATAQELNSTWSDLSVNANRSAEVTSHLFEVLRDEFSRNLSKAGVWLNATADSEKARVNLVSDRLSSAWQEVNTTKRENAEIFRSLSEDQQRTFQEQAKAVGEVKEWVGGVERINGQVFSKYDSIDALTAGQMAELQRQKDILVAKLAGPPKASSAKFHAFKWMADTEMRNLAADTEVLMSLIDDAASKFRVSREEQGAALKRRIEAVYTDAKPAFNMNLQRLDIATGLEIDRWGSVAEQYLIALHELQQQADQSVRSLSNECAGNRMATLECWTRLRLVRKTFDKLYQQSKEPLLKFQAELHDSGHARYQKWTE